MSLTLGEKLRQAREEKGMTVGEVAEQTRISPLYIESIENDDYRALPGGIFNRGFVKSFAKYVGVDEQEALADYARLLYEIEGDTQDVKFHRPEVLTDDRASSSMLPTLIVAAVILGVMTVGVLFVLRQFRSPETSANDAAPRSSVTPSETITTAETESTAAPQPLVPDLATLQVEFKAVSGAVALSVTANGKTTNQTINADSSFTFEPNGSIRLSYSKWVAEFARLELNGKNITLPKTPLDPKRPNNIEFEINEDNLSSIWSSGKIPPDGTPTSAAANGNIASPPSRVNPADRIPTNTVRQSIAPNTALRSQSENKAAAEKTPARLTPRPRQNPQQIDADRVLSIIDH